MIYYISSRLIRIFAILYMFARCEGLKNIPKGGVMICSAHKSNFDPVIIGSFIKQRVYYMAKAELFKFPLFAAFLKAVGAFPVRRGINDTSAVKGSLRLLKDGKPLLIFPQGTRSRQLKREEFKNGAIIMALKANVPIMPVGICGEYGMFSRVRVRFGKPIMPSEFPSFKPGEEKTAAEAVKNILFDRIKALIEGA